MAALQAERGYGLSCGRLGRGTRVSVFHVKLTESALRAFESYQACKVGAWGGGHGPAAGGGWPPRGPGRSPAGSTGGVGTAGKAERGWGPRSCRCRVCDGEMGRGVGRCEALPGERLWRCGVPGPPFCVREPGRAAIALPGA